MNIKKKNYIISLICMFIFACLLCCGIFAAVSKAVSFNLALKLDPQIYFSLSMKIDKTGTGTYSEEYKIFDNSEDATGIVNWATVNQNCIVLNQVMAGNILSGLTTSSRFEIIVTNLTDTTGYLNLTLNYNGAEEVFKVDNGYGAVNMAHGVASGETCATKSFKLIPQTALLDGYIQIPFKAEIDTELRYTAKITTTNCEVVSAPRTFVLHETYTAKFDAPKVYCPSYTYTVTVNGSPYETTTNTSTLQIPGPLVTGNINIHCTASHADYTVTLNTASGSGGTTSITFTSGTNAYYDSSNTSQTITQITIPTRQYYNFEGYYSQENGNGVQYISADGTITANLSALTGNATLYAYWTEMQVYTVTLNRNGGTGGEDYIYFRTGINEYFSDSNCSSQITQIDIPTLSGYNFLGYYSGDTQYITNTGVIASTLCNLSAHITLTAQWEEIPMVTVTLNNQTATTVAYNTIYYAIGTNKYYSDENCQNEITSNFVKPTQTGSVFKGYYTELDSNGGAGTQYINASGAFVNNLCNLTSSITLYAYWVWDGSTTVNGNGTIATGANLAYLASGVNDGTITSGTYTQTQNIYLNDEKFTFMPDTGLVHVTDGINTCYLGTGAKGDTSGTDSTFDEAASVKGAVYNSSYTKTDDAPTSNTTVNYGINGKVNFWTEIGYYNTYPDYAYFRGTYDGGEFEVSGIYINTTSDYQGLFGCTDSGSTIQNVGLVNSYIKGDWDVGGVCGYNNGGTITNCYNTGTVTGRERVGGVCGLNTGTITNCYNTGTVTGTSDIVGGVCGWNNATITNCYNTGTVSGFWYVGGVCGRLDGSIIDCTNAGDVTGVKMVGGICGAYNSAFCKVEDINGGIVDETTNTGTIIENGTDVSSEHVLYGAAFSEK